LWNCGSGTVPSQYVAKIMAETHGLRRGQPCAATHRAPVLSLEPFAFHSLAPN
jgi:hypothetical protein